jgi:predicted membrane channel-forming protein YqfA (hemolysin III family)
LETEQCQDADDEGKVLGNAYDQYEVKDDGRRPYLLNLVYSVMCKGCCQEQPKKPKGQVWNYVVGKDGHLERFSAWSHLVAFVAFVVYTIVRHTLFYRDSTAFAWVTFAAAVTAFTFFSSVVYHVTSPDKHISMVTRQLDYIAIYMSIAVCSVADLATVTRGFVNVPIVSIVDVPMAATVLALFFAFRRYELPLDETWTEEYGGCTFGVGLLRRWHHDSDHSSLRQAGSFAIASFYFTMTPAVIANALDAQAILGLQAGALMVVVGGMLLDNVAGWPDNIWHRSKKGPPCTSFPYLGCALNSHGLWHLLALLGAVMTAIAREWTVRSL